MLEAFLAATIATLLAQAAPGPNLLAVAAAALGQGRRAALFVVFGITSGVFIWVTIVALGVGGLLTAIPELLVAFKVLGGAYLAYLGYKALRLAITGQNSAFSSDPGPTSGFVHWRTGLLVVMTNPKAALMWIAISSLLFGYGLSSVAVLAFAPIGAATALLVYGVYAWLFSTARAARVYAKATRPIEAALGLTFGGLGAALVFDGLRQAQR